MSRSSRWVAGLLAVLGATGCQCGVDMTPRPVCLDSGTRATTGPSCDPVRPPSRRDAGTPTPNAECNIDADCTAGLNGRCFMGNGLTSAPRLQCAYDACLSDQDCAPGHVCSCQPRGPLDQGFVGHQCVPANCATNADCADTCCTFSRAFCSPEVKTGFFCRTRQDECVTDADCVSDGGTAPHDGFCAFSPMAARWVCTHGFCQP